MSTTTARALIVDDEADICELLALTLIRMGIDSQSAYTLTEAKRRLQQQHFDLCLTDLRLPDGNGLELVEHIQKHYHQMPVAVISAHGNIESAVHALKCGAFDFLSKPIDLEVFRTLIQSVLKLATPPAQPTALALIGQSAAIEKTRQMIQKLARSQAPVYISGESGVGKELVARLIHAQSPRADQAFVAVNCGAIPQELMESEFFGHKKGSFTNAYTDKAGLFQVAHNGTLFLDEVADLPLAMQVKLLRAIQEKSIRPIGATKEIKIDTRILSATHQDLAALVESGKFRQDLFYRINVIELRVPPLRERREDIPLLAQHLLKKISVNPVQIRERALQVLMQYHFPGNVRELENILERALTLCNGNWIEETDLGLPLVPDVQPSANPADIPAIPHISTDPAMHTPLVAKPAGVSLETYLEQVEKQLITDALAQTRYNKTAAAKHLGISFRALRYRLKKLGLE